MVARGANRRTANQKDLIPIAIRLSQGDIQAARRLAANEGIGIPGLYQARSAASPPKGIQPKITPVSKRGRCDGLKSRRAPFDSETGNLKRAPH
jgi:hypothetical protein